VAASSLRALNFEQMICKSSGEYIALAARLASDPAALRHIEEKLWDDRRMSFFPSLTIAVIWKQLLCICTPLA
jgi:predicted O-linked N-acetylglucosamine transferase (SPINDLY family)